VAYGRTWDHHLLVPRGGCESRRVFDANMQMCSQLQPHNSIQNHHSAPPNPIEPLPDATDEAPLYRGWHSFGQLWDVLRGRSAVPNSFALLLEPGNQPGLIP